jgi:hypothetical protein
MLNIMSVPELSLQWPPVELIDRVSIKAPSTGHQCSQAGCSVVRLWKINSNRPCTQVQHAMCCGSLHEIRTPLEVCSPTMPAVVHESSAGRAHDCEAASHILRRSIPRQMPSSCLCGICLARR